MSTVADYISQLEQAIKGMDKVVVDSVAKNSDLLASMNLNRLEQGLDTKGGVLTNINSLFKGEYTMMTQSLSLIDEPRPLLPKQAGSLYNFVNTGIFASSFQFEYANFKLIIENTGTGGSNDKGIFFDGYGDELLGYTKEQLEIIEKDIILKEICGYFQRKGF